MATNVGRLAATLSLNSRAFSAGLKTAGGAMRSFTGMITGAHAKLAGLFAAVAGVGLGALIKGSFEAIDSAGKLADRLGATTEGLVALQHGANLAGVSVEQLETGLSRFYRVVSDAADGNQAAADSFAALGLDAKELNRLPLEDALGRVADAMNSLERPTDRMRVAMELFGRGGAPLINFLEAGSDGIREMRKEADKLGITFSRIDAKKVEEANDAVSRLRAVFRGLANAIAIQLAPAITVVTNKFIEMGTAGAGAGVIAADGFGKLAQAIIFVGDELDTVVILFKKMQILATHLAKVFTFMRYASNPFNGTDLPGELDSIGKSIERMEKELDERLKARGLGDKARRFFQDIKNEADRARSLIGKGAGNLNGVNGGLPNTMSTGPSTAPPLLQKGSSEAYRFLREFIQPSKTLIPGHGQQQQNQIQMRQLYRLQNIERYLHTLVTLNTDGAVEVGIA